MAWAGQLPPPQPQRVFSVAAVCRETSLQHRGFISEAGDDLPAHTFILFGGYVECFDVSVCMAPFVRPLPTHAQHHCTHTHTHTHTHMQPAGRCDGVQSPHRISISERTRSAPSCPSTVQGARVSQPCLESSNCQHGQQVRRENSRGAHTEPAPHSDA